MKVASVMSKPRFEAFSDGVFAVAVTLLVLDFKVPDLTHASDAQALASILVLWKPLLSYATSFIVVGVVWINHHTIFHTIESIDRATVVFNLVLLLLVALIPYPTALIGLYSNSQPVVMLYGLVMTANGLAFTALFLYVRTRHNVAERIGATPQAIRASWIRGASYPIGYFLGAMLSYVNTTLSIAAYVVLPIVFLFPSAVEYQFTRKFSPDRDSRETGVERAVDAERPAARAQQNDDA
jgi:uncharacterized membrane protein